MRRSICRCSILTRIKRRMLHNAVTHVAKVDVCQILHMRMCGFVFCFYIQIYFIVQVLPFRGWCRPTFSPCTCSKGLVFGWGDISWSDICVVMLTSDGKFFLERCSLLIIGRAKGKWDRWQWMRKNALKQIKIL